MKLNKRQRRIASVVLFLATVSQSTTSGNAFQSPMTTTTTTTTAKTTRTQLHMQTKKRPSSSTISSSTSSSTPSPLPLPLRSTTNGRTAGVTTTQNRKSLSAVSVSNEWQSAQEQQREREQSLLPFLQRDGGSNNEWLSDTNINRVQFDQSFLTETILPVLTTSLLITGNTVGAGMLVLPELASGPGMGISTSIFLAAFGINLLSGLLISEVAITQHEQAEEANEEDASSSSFKEFAQANLPQNVFPWAANAIAGISIFVNSLVMAFNMSKMGDLLSGLVDSSSPSPMGDVGSGLIAVIWAVACMGLVGSQTFTALSEITSLLVTGLFLSFGGLLLPGLAHMTVDPLTLLTSTPGTSEDIVASATQLAPIVLMSLVYQNIVPTVTKLLDYDRTKTTLAITLGSFLPLAMYIAWAFAVVGGGVSTDTGAAGAGSLEAMLMMLFTVTTIGGSSIGCIMSLSEEFDSFLKSMPLPFLSVDETTNSEPNQQVFGNENKDKEMMKKETDKFSWPAVVASVGTSWMASQFFQHDLNEALKVAGSFGSPLLYGLLPVVMVYVQREQKNNEQQRRQGNNKGESTGAFPSSKTISTTTMSSNNGLPIQIPAFGLGILGAASSGLIGNELWQSAEQAFASVPL